MGVNIYAGSWLLVIMIKRPSVYGSEIEQRHVMEHLERPILSAAGDAVPRSLWGTLLWPPPVPGGIEVFVRHIMGDGCTMALRFAGILTP